MAKGNGASNDADGSAVSPRGRSVPKTSSEWLSEVTIGDVAQRVLEKFQHQPPILIRDSAMAVISGAVTGVKGAMHNGKIYLFGDLLRSKAEEARTLFHERLRYGLRQFLIMKQFISQMLRSYERDGAIRAEADG